jgi:hypothetical protein
MSRTSVELYGFSLVDNSHDDKMLAKLSAFETFVGERFAGTG